MRFPAARLGVGEPQEVALGPEETSRKASSC